VNAVWDSKSLSLAKTKKKMIQFSVSREGEEKSQPQAWSPLLGGGCSQVRGMKGEWVAIGAKKKYYINAGGERTHAGKEGGEKRKGPAKAVRTHWERCLL